MKECDVLGFHELFGKKWTYPLFYALSDQPQGFNDLQKMTKREINPSLLSDRLKKLVGLGLVEKKVVEEKSCYVISPTGQRVKDVLFEIKKIGDDLGWHTPEECRDKDCADWPFFSQGEAAVF